MGYSYYKEDFKILLTLTVVLLTIFGFIYMLYGWAVASERRQDEYKKANPYMTNDNFIKEASKCTKAGLKYRTIKSDYDNSWDGRPIGVICE
jgi:hypothetical protein